MNSISRSTEEWTMAERVYRLSQQTDRPLAAIFDQISKQLGAELVEAIGHDVAGVQTLLAVFEKFYFRVESYVSVTLLLTAHDGLIQADIIGSGGGGGIFNISWGANADLADLLARQLEALGFEKE